MSTYSHEVRLTPPSRTDTYPWTIVHIYESSDGVAFAQLPPQAFPVDSDPSTAETVAITFTTASLPTGYYKFQFEDAAGVFTEFTNTILDPSDDPMRPTVTEVAQRTYARTLDANGNRGEYNDTTRPTAAQVESLIDDAISVVKAAVGSAVPVAQQGAAKYAVICRVAMGIERGNYPEGTNTDDSAYQAWSAEYTASIGAVVTGINQDQPNQSRIGMISVIGDPSITSRAPATEIPVGWGVL